uniref:S24 family peptidase n=1 Tax=Pantoea anthophila TaxID=470931 RepID=UPI0035A07D99
MAFQNPAQNFAEQRLNLGDLVTLSPHSTFLVRSDSSYPEAGIMQGSVLAINRAITPQHRHIIVAEIEGELVLRRLLINPVPAAYTVVILHGCAGSGPAETSALCSRESCSYAVTVCCSLSNSMDEL